MPPMIRSMSCAPVVLLAFNRPDKIAAVLEQIRVAQPADLFIGSDGPREGFAADPERCREVRQLLDSAVDWPCDVRRVDWPTNRGCEANTELTLDAAFEEVPQAIVLDDDCVPHPSFFRFASELLELYAADDRIVHIAGTNDGAARELFEGFSYAFTAFGSNWGWATWARAWRRHRALFPRPHDSRTVRVPYGQPPRYMPQAEPRTFHAREAGLTREPTRRFFDEVGRARDLSLSEWGQQWRLSMLNERGLAITPSMNLIENIGFDAESTSDMPTLKMRSAERMEFPLRHPTRVAINNRVEDVLEVTLIRAVGRMARNLRRWTPRPLRGVARRTGRLIVR